LYEAAGGVFAQALQFSHQIKRRHTNEKVEIQ